MKKRFLILALVLAITFSAIFAVSVFAAEEPTLAIPGKNLAFEDSIAIIFLVDAQNVSADEVDLLIWSKPQEEYTYGTHEESMKYTRTQTSGGKKYLRFEYRGLVAKQMAEDVYVRAYVNRDGKEYYSDVTKYSVLQYAYNKLGKTGTAGSAAMQEFLVEILNYGAAAQKYLGYNTDRLANADFYQIKVAGGTISDGTASGLFLPTDVVTIVAPEVDAQGVPFAYWKNSAGEKVSETATANVSASKNETFTAVYEMPYSKGLAYTSNGDGTCYVSGIGTCTDTDIIIPAVSPEGDSVTKIANGVFYANKNLTSVVMSEGITSIEESAFCACSNIVSVVIPNSVTNIGRNAFFGCKGLTSIVIPEGVTSIGTNAFYECTGLTSVVIPDSVTSIGGSVFSYCESLTSIVIPDSITSIGESMFSYCEGLTSAVIPDSVTSIDRYAFYGCKNLKLIQFTGTKAQWDSISFGQNWNLLVPSDLVITFKHTLARIRASEATCEFSGNIEYWRCYDCGAIFLDADGANEISIEETVIPAKGHRMGEWKQTIAPTCTKEGKEESTCSVCGYKESRALSKVSHSYKDGYCTFCGEVKASVGLKFTSNGDGTCYVSGMGNCTDTNVIIPELSPNGDRVTAIGEEAFIYSYSLTSIVIPDSVMSIGSYAFSACKNLTSVVIPDSVTTISEHAFTHCTGLTSIVIPEGVTSISDYTFFNCESLVSVELSKNLTEIGFCAFYNCNPDIVIKMYDLVESIDTFGIAGSFTTGKAHVIYYGTEEQFKAIDIDSSMDVLFKDNFSWFVRIVSENVHEHTEATLQGVAPTCEEAGLTDGIYCSECGEVILAQEVIPAKGHSMGEWTQTIAPTCTKEGKEESTCSVCGYRESRALSMVSHSYKDGYCTVCGERKTSVGLEFKSNGDGTCYVSGIGTCTDTDIIIPERSPAGELVTGISDYAFFSCTEITSVKIPDSVTYIGYASFYNCASLVSVELGKNLTVISKHAFGLCHADIVIKMYNKVETIDAYAIAGSFSGGMAHIIYYGTEEQFKAIDIHSSMDLLFKDNFSWFVRIVSGHDHLHTKSILQGVAPTCDEAGLTDGVYCSDCGAILVNQELIARKEHDIKNGECTLCDYKVIDYSDPALYESSYGYDFLGTLANGTGLQEFYRRLDAIAKKFHVSADMNAVGEPYKGGISLSEYAYYSDLGLSFNDACMVMYYIELDRPLYYWLNNTYSFNKTAGCIWLHCNELYANGEDRAYYNALVYEFVAKYLDEVRGDSDIYTKVLGFHDMLTTSVEYAYDNNGDPQSAIWAHSIMGAVTGDGVVCEGYTKLLQLLFTASGIESIVVDGNPSAPHSWNLVKLDDGNWYWIDATWNDPSWEVTYSYTDDIRHNYFCVNDTQYVNWFDELLNRSSPTVGSTTFVDEHTPYNMTSSDYWRKLYDLPARSDKVFGEEGILELREAFTVNGYTYALVGYNKVQLVATDAIGFICIPEYVYYGGDVYEVVSVGAMCDDYFFTDNEQAVSGSVIAVILPESVEYIWALALGNGGAEIYYLGSEQDWADVGVNESVFRYVSVYFYSEAVPQESGNYWHYVGGEAVKW